MRNLVKIAIAFSVLCCFSETVFSQDFNEERRAFSNYLVRMYKANPFEGVKVVNDYDNEYLLAVLSLEASKYNNPSTMNRVASVKAMSMASRYQNGSEISDDMVITIHEKYDGTVETEQTERITENSIGYVKSLELLTNFNDDSGRTVFLFIQSMGK